MVCNRCYQRVDGSVARKEVDAMLPRQDRHVKIALREARFETRMKTMLPHPCGRFFRMLVPCRGPEHHPIGSDTASQHIADGTRK